MKRLVALSLTPLLLLGLAASARADVYAVDWDINNGVSSLYRLNTTTGVASTVGLTGIVRLVGLAESSTGTLYSVNESDTSNVSSNLYTINPTTGVATLVGPLGFAVAEGDLTIDPSTGTLYVANAGPDQLLRVNPITGAATLVGSGVPGRDVSALLFSGNVLYGLALNDASPDTLNTINTTTGAGTQVGATSTNLGVIAAMGQDPSNGKTFIAGPLTNFGNDNRLFTENLTTGAATSPVTISGIRFSISGVAPIAAVTSVPEPSQLVLAGVGLAAAGLVRLRRRVGK